MLHKVASIVPVAHLDLTRDDSYFMALSYACSDLRYTQFFRDRTAEGKYVILDNSAVEKGVPEPLQDYLEKAIQMNASEILSPDFFRDGPKTFDAIEDTLEAGMRYGYHGNIMIVPQGDTTKEWCDFIRRAALEYPFTTVGISRRYTDMFGGRRVLAVILARDTLLEVERPDVKIHLLGCWERPKHDISDYLSQDYVRGIDGSLPSVFAKYDRLLEENADRPGPVIDILEDKYDEEILRFNIGAFKRLCSGLAG